MSFRHIVLIVATLHCLSTAARPQNACVGKPQVLVLGTYHMANPGRDVYNMKVDDVRVPKRQQELAAVADVLARFQPTEIAIEADPDDKAIPAAYQDYVAGKHELSQNEIEQIGFRLAKKMGHKQVYPVNVDGEFPIQRVMDYAKAKDRSQELEKLMEPTGQAVAKDNAYINSHTVLESLLYMNSPDSVAADVDFYMQMASFGEDGDYAGPDLLTDWYQRNIRIYGNIVKLIASPDDRILVIYGAGHLGWLQEDVKMNSHLCLRTLADFVAAR